MNDERILVPMTMVVTPDSDGTTYFLPSGYVADKVFVFARSGFGFPLSFEQVGQTIRLNVNPGTDSLCALCRGIAL